MNAPVCLCGHPVAEHGDPYGTNPNGGRGCRWDGCLCARPSSGPAAPAPTPESPERAMAYRAAVEERDALRIRVDALEAELAALRPHLEVLARGAARVLHRVEALCSRADVETSAGDLSEPTRGGDSEKR